MTFTRLEDLPNELFLELFVYFTRMELNSTWLEWKLNSRIQTLAQVAQAHVAFDISSILFRTYDQCLYYFEHEHPTMSYRIISLLFNESVLSNEIVRHWLENGPSFFPRIHTCTIYFYLVNKYVRLNIVRLLQQNASTLRRVVFYFKTFEEYEVVLKRIINRRISLHTMELIIIKGNRKGSFLPKIFFQTSGIFLLDKFLSILVSFSDPTDFLIEKNVIENRNNI
jgi:hypothetical protein